MAAACERYERGDFICACSVLYTRIEGILRSVKKLHTGTARGNQGSLAEWAIGGRGGSGHRETPLVPGRFREYLSRMYFAEFDADTPASVSRHTVSHGVAPAVELNLKSATIGFLTLKQLLFYVGAADSQAGRSA